IRKRGRTYEAHITDAYLENIQRQYMEFIRQHQDMRVVIINTQGLDFVSHEADYLKLKTLIQREYPIGITRISDLS
ncbi:MAG: deoxynucleoside kinase, partial [Flavobacteriales bacterium]